MSEEKPNSRTVSTAVIRSLIAKARKRSTQRVIGVRGDPTTENERRLTDAGEPVHVLACISSLAVLDALRHRADDEWLVIITDRPENDLGAGILGKFAHHQLQAPGVREVLMERFGADRIDRPLATLQDLNAVGRGILRITPDEGWPAVPGAILSIDHAFSAVVTRQLAFPTGPVDALTILEWSSSPDAARRLVDMREFGGPELTDAVLSWLAERAGQAGGPILSLLQSDRTGEVLPVGLVMDVLTDTTLRTPEDLQLTEVAFARLEVLWAGSEASIQRPMLAALGQSARSVVEACLNDPVRSKVGNAALQAAEQMLSKIQASALARDSLLLPTGLAAALQNLADALSSFPTSGTDPVEKAWTSVEAHWLAHPMRGNTPDPRVAPFHAAVRLSRWLGDENVLPSNLADAARLHLQSDAWVDVAYNDAAEGVSDQRLAEGLTTVLRLTEERRRAHDRTFAKLLAASTAADEGGADGFLRGEGDRVWHLERLLPSLIMPLARNNKTLLLVLDGMSAATATELTSSILQGNRGWIEVIPKYNQRRGAAVAVLPTLTTLSRSSLFNGQLTTGGQNVETSGFAAVTKAGGVRRSVLFHKAPLDSSRPGLALQDDIAATISDPQTNLVACVLNTIDDALDKSDPGGITWTTETIRHLRPLLLEAMAAGRTVVLTSDHGHIVERRQGERATVSGITSARSRNAGAAGKNEVLVEGRRVLTEDNRAVLAVDDTLRYSSVKAGYHGGASPAEVVVPVVVLVPGDSIPSGWKEAPVSEPQWWSVPKLDHNSPQPTLQNKLMAMGEGQTSSLFEASAELVSERRGIGSAVIKSKTFKAQKKIAGRVAVGEEEVQTLLDALVAAPGTRLTKEACATILRLPPMRINGAAAQLQKLLNVEGYGVLLVDGAFLVLDSQLLIEQFEVKKHG